MKTYRRVLVLAMTCAWAAGVYGAPSLSARIKSGIQQLPGGFPEVANKRTGVAYDLSLSSETFYIEVPHTYTGGNSFGLVVFMSTSDECNIPSDWKTTLAKEKLIYISPQNAGNNQPTSRRCGLAVAAAAKMAELANIDKNRVFVSGFSGGARIACMTAFYHPDMFSGCLAICGAQFFEHVEKKHATKNDDYGYFSLQGGLPEAAKARLRFALITGAADFRRGNILDLCYGGFQKQGLATKLFDVRGMGHELCSQNTLNEALAFVDQQRSPADDARGLTEGKTVSANSQDKRTWTSLSGATQEAELTKVVGSLVYLKRQDGSTITIQLSSLSPADREFVHKALGK